MRLALEEILSLTRPDLGSFVWHTGPGGGGDPEDNILGLRVRDGRGSNITITHKEVGHVGTHEGFYLWGLERKEDRGADTHTPCELGKRRHWDEDGTGPGSGGGG